MWYIVMDEEKQICPKCKLVITGNLYSGTEGKMMRHVLFSHTIPEYVRELLYEQEKYHKKE
jgi:hypothetical protein